MSPNGRYLFLVKTNYKIVDGSYNEYRDVSFVDLESAQTYTTDDLMVKSYNVNVAWMPNGQIYFENAIYDLSE